AYSKVLQSSANALENQAYRGAGEMVFAKVPPDSATLRAMSRYGGSVGAAQGAIFGGDAVTSDSVLNRLQRFEVFESRAGAGSLQFLLGRGLMLVGLGQFAPAREVFDSARKVSPDQATAIMMWPLMIGFAPPGYAPELLALIETGPRRSPFQTYFHAVIRLNRGERAEGTRLLDSLLAHRDPKMPPKLYDLVGAAKGWTTMMAGDTAAGIRQMRTGLENVGAGWNSFMTAPIRLQLATALAQRPDTREEG